MQRLIRWRDPDREVLETSSGDDGCTIAGALAHTSGWIALLDDARLVAAVTDNVTRVVPSDEPGVLLPALELADGPVRAETALESERALRAVDEWIASDWTRRSSGLDAGDTPLRRRVLRSLDDALRIAPRHRRAAIVGRAARSRRALTRPLPLGIERELDQLVDERAARADWVEEADRLLCRGPIGAPESTSLGRPRCRALIVFGP